MTGDSAPRGRRMPRDRRRIVAIVNDVPRQHEGLGRALEPFGGVHAFDHDAYIQALETTGPEFDRTALAERYWTVLQNHLASLAQLGLSEARRLEIPGAADAGRGFTGLFELGVLGERDAIRLFEIQAVRTSDQHFYPAQAEQVIDAMLDLHRLVPRFMRDYGAWFTQLPY